MTKKKLNLNAEEKEMLKAFENNEMVSVDNLEGEKSKAKVAAKNTNPRSKPITIRLPLKDLAAIQKKAEETGLHYQTLINLIIHQYSEGKIQITL